MKSIESAGKTIDDAVSAGLAELGLTIGDVDMEVLDEGAKGLFGLLGGKDARVRLTQKDNAALQTERFLLTLCEKIGLDVKVETELDEEGQVHAQINGDNMGILIGYRGATMDALQYLTSLAINRGKEEYHRILLDVESYRARREESLKRLAEKMATKAKRTGRKVVLEPMNPFERRVLHSYLQNDPAVATHSEGEEPNRRIVITLN